MSDRINKLHRYMRIGLNRNGQFPSQNDLIKKLDLSVEAFKELIIDAQESGRDIRPDTFELNQYLKININEIEFGTDEKEPFGYKDFIHYHFRSLLHRHHHNSQVSKIDLQVYD